MKELLDLFEEQFIPLAERLNRQGAVALDLKFRKTASMWTTVDASRAPLRCFEIPAALERGDTDPESFADGIIASWDTAPSDPALRQLLRSLIALGLRYPPAGSLEEEVSESIYVMF